MSRYYRLSNLYPSFFLQSFQSSYQSVTNIPYARNSNKTVQHSEITVISLPLPEIDHRLISGLDSSYLHPTPLLPRYAYKDGKP